MRKASFFLVFIITAINALAQTGTDTTGYTKAPDGSEYKIIRAAGGAKLVNGNFMELSVVAKCKDSLLFSTYDDAMPQYGLYDTAQFPVPFKNIFQNIYVGDSIVLRILNDSLMAKGQGAPFMHSGDYIYQYYTVRNLYTTKAQADSAQSTHAAAAKTIATKKQQEQIAELLAGNKALIAKDSKTIDGYLAKNKLKAIKGKMGTYIVIKKAGTGKKLAQGDVASVNYTGRSFSTSKVFDSNIDPKFQHVEPYDVKLDPATPVILGWKDALAEMQKGTKATVYIPSTLAYGSQSPSPDIAADEILVFDMEVANVKTEGGAVPAKAAAPVKKPVAAKAKPVAAPKTKTTIKKAGQ
jgi:FKBP-type peptidyl-prolyl cis-trans isomerase